MTRLEQRPQPQIPDLGPLSARVTALEQRPPPQGGTAAPAPDLAPLERRLTALEQRQPPNLAPLEARLAALEAASRADAGRPVPPAGRGRRPPRRERKGRSADSPGAGGRHGPGRRPEARRPARRAAGARAVRRRRSAHRSRAAPGVSPGRARGARGLPSGQRRPAAADAPMGPGAGPRHRPPGRSRADRRSGRRRAGACPCRSGGWRPCRRRRRRLPRWQGAAAQAMSAWLAQARSLLEARAALAAWAASG